jgi:glycine/D-amino acid oxidase-like deaminating enzyme
MVESRINRRRFLRLAGGIALSAQMNRAWADVPGHVVIVGAGIMGASIAYHMVRWGVRVTILEKERPVPGATRKSFAWLNAGGKRPRSYYELNLLGMHGWRRLSIEIGPELPVQFGGCLHWTGNAASAERLRKSVAAQGSLGYSVRLIAEKEIRALLPKIVPGPVVAASFADLEGTVDPLGAAQVLLARAKSLGTALEYPCEVTGFVIASGKVGSVVTSKGNIEADAFVLASGNGIPPLAEKVGRTVPLVESPGVLAHTVPLPRLLPRVSVCDGAALKQNPDGRVVTGTDFGGTPDVQPTQEEGEKLLAAAARYVPELKGAKLDFMTLGHSDALAHSRPACCHGSAGRSYLSEVPPEIQAIIESPKTQKSIRGFSCPPNICDCFALLATGYG